MNSRNLARFGWILVTGGAMVLAGRMMQSGATALGIIFAALGIFVAWVYQSPRTHALRYLLPGLAAFAIFILLPLLYTVYIAFTNFSGDHLLTRDRVRAWFAQDLYAPEETRYRFRLHPGPAPGSFQIVIPLQAGEFGRNLWISRPFTPEEAASGNPITLTLNIQPPATAPLSIREVIAARPWLLRARFAPPAATMPLRLVSLRALGYRLPLWQEQGDTFIHALTRQVLVPDPKRGNYVDKHTGEPVGPGWRVWIGAENFRQIFTDPALRGPFLQIFAWNVAFALLSVVLTFAVGVFLASLLQWKELAGRKIYRTLLILPYAIPAFIPILTFKGLFNESYGEINRLLSAVWGLSPRWFTDPLLARIMILIVNTWLGYPYMMLIASGMLQAVAEELYEASAMDGAGPWTNFWHITLPQIVPPLFPLLVASFAFNFNNFSLIFLLTGGKPDIPGAATVAGTTDLIVSYTFRMAFKDSAARFGFAAAVASLLFILVALLAWAQLRLARPAAAAPRKRNHP